MEKQNAEFNWKIHENPEQTLEIVSSLEEALKSKDVDAVQKVLQDPENLRSLIQRRGQNSASHSLLESSFSTLLEEKFGLADIYQRNGKEIIDFIHEYNLPEQILIEYLDVAFHKRDKILLNRLAAIIFENEEKLENKSIIAAALHNIASWKTMEENDPQESLNYNKRALEAAKGANDSKLIQKIKYGLTYTKDLKPKDKILGFENVIAGMEALDHNYDAMKARVDEAFARIELARRQKGLKQQSERDNNLGIALELIKAAYNYSTLKKISNLEVMALEAFSKVYREMGDTEKANQNKRKAELAFGKYGYLTKRV